MHLSPARQQGGMTLATATRAPVFLVHRQGVLTDRALSFSVIAGLFRESSIHFFLASIRLLHSTHPPIYFVPGLYIP